MAIVRKYGKPDLFVTLTCNPKWKEIQENLLPGQQAHERPDLLARVFWLKFKEFINLLEAGKLFGKVVSYTYSVEWQNEAYLMYIYL